MFDIYASFLRCCGHAFGHGRAGMMHTLRRTREAGTQGNKCRRVAHVETHMAMLERWKSGSISAISLGHNRGAAHDGHIERRARTAAGAGLGAEAGQRHRRVVAPPCARVWGTLRRKRSGDWPARRRDSNDATIARVGAPCAAESDRAASGCTKAREQAVPRGSSAARCAWLSSLSDAACCATPDAPECMVPTLAHRMPAALLSS